MPNFFYGQIRIYGDTFDQLGPILDWTNKCNTIDYESGVPFNSLVPLTSMGDTYDEEKWVYEEACQEWGSKWGVADVKSIYHTTEYVNFHYESAWNMPNGLFDGLQEKYGVRIYSHGYEEGCGFYTAYANGKCDTYHYDQSDFDKWVKDKGINLPDYEKEPEEYREAYDDKILDFLDDKGSWLVQELNGGNSIFKTHPVGEY